jgi:class 3 adenylate cyclase
MDTSVNSSNTIQLELDRRIFHLKTLYDVSKDIFSSVDFESILKNFLLMTMGNFGVMEGFILTYHSEISNISHFESFGIKESDLGVIREKISDFAILQDERMLFKKQWAITNAERFFPTIRMLLPFTIDTDLRGVLGMGEKLVEEAYSKDDIELLTTLINNLVISLRNATSFENILRLNKDLSQKNIELENALSQLKDALRKVEILESIKANLTKFVPKTVSRIIEKSPTASIFENREQEVSILFIDIQGYTRLSEKLDGGTLNNLVELYFSVFMDAIHANNGDVNETAGDGLMVLFLNNDQKLNAFEAVQTAMEIKKKTAHINQDNKGLEPLLINMGISSGKAHVGASKFESYTGSRWTYTARGFEINVASRIASLATDGSVLMSKTTAERVQDCFTLELKGRFRLKNVTNEIEIFSIS